MSLAAAARPALCRSMAVHGSPAGAARAALPQHRLVAVRPASCARQTPSIASVAYISGAGRRRWGSSGRNAAPAGGLAAASRRKRRQHCSTLSLLSPPLAGSSSLFSAQRQQQRRQHRRQQLGVEARARDPDALDDDDSAEAANREPPSLFWRCFAAMCYLVPWIDSISLGRAMYQRFRNLLMVYFAPGACMCGGWTGLGGSGAWLLGRVALG